MNLSEAVDALERYGSAQDPIEYKGKETTPEELVYTLHWGTPAATIRVTYWGGPDVGREIKGTLTGMLADRKKLARRLKREEKERR